MIQFLSKAERSKYFFVSFCFTCTSSTGAFNVKKLWLQMTEMGPYDMQWAFHLSQEQKDISIQANIKDFQSHGNTCELDISRPRIIAFCL